MPLNLLRDFTIREQLRIQVEGTIQGVGMRPFVFQLAERCRQSGWVANTGSGLTIAIEGAPELQRQFLDGLNNPPPPATIFSLSVDRRPLENFSRFEIRSSEAEGQSAAFVLPDLAICGDCLQDLFDPAGRFYRYPFTSCSRCGPRYSIIGSLPYDRERTAMAGFALCQDCARDYRDPGNRRFHAQTIACAQCGPVLSLHDRAGNRLADGDRVLEAACGHLREGSIIAVKGIGGFQLWADAAAPVAVERLRIRKHRPAKPFALMVPGIEDAEALCFLSGLERQALASPAAPIILLKRRPNAAVTEAVAPDNTMLGVMLAYAPLHHLLLRGFGAPVVATSGNRHGEPICIDNAQALERLADIADCFLLHDRPILRPLDDSVARVINGRLTLLRRARGYVPQPILSKTILPNALAVGGHLKNTVALGHDLQMIVSPHIGDLDCDVSVRQCEATLADLRQFYQRGPKLIAHDLHEDYGASRIAEREAQRAEKPVQTVKVQHHYAHVLACMAEHGLEPPLLGVVFDGNGLGSDNTLWGGEFLRIHGRGFERFAHLRAFSLPGGEKAIREPRRAALGLLYALEPERAFERMAPHFSAAESNLLASALKKGINCPLTTSAGRLFDAAASLLGLCQVNRFEGQAAIALEQCAAAVESDLVYDFRIAGEGTCVIDWQPMIEQLLTDIPTGNHGLIARKFHNTLAAMIAAIAERAGEPAVALSGGCFQNALLVEQAAGKLKTAGFRVYCHEKIPPNDGGLSLGQLYAVKYLG
ncbi:MULTISPECIES: carbamoyltransferase HypF [Methylomicrobium]|uniref:Carbamoyltransferase HypF n=1 Tax=Methylomicrobium album BG8 TaxID=686340 RepID=H8GHZ1_METAL|nr:MULTISPECIES: carbamoyltransferase HypF [Methylomicrobium]EIC28975.1 (NiFe) hydrogenase maturation protein HypF [Methylomicrobium album BG8]